MVNYSIVDADPKLSSKIPVASYARMSTEHQRYSIMNQMDVIRSYADENDMEIIASFSDKGKSGLNVKGRAGLTSLLTIVNSGNAPFNNILVYDVSRWGRFQDADESAYYEYSCKRQGIEIHYCAEQFENDGSPFSAIVKSLKRAMAAEYSRELSFKVFTGQCRLIKKGFKQGGSAGYGLRRMLIDEQGNYKQTLKAGERKSITTDRVILVLGPSNEVKIVKEIYKLFINKNKAMTEIANILNKKGIIAEMGGDWTRSIIKTILTNEKYIGNNVFNKHSSILGTKRVYNHPNLWVRADKVFEPIISKPTFKKAQLVAKRPRMMSDKEMIDKLKRLYKKHGYLTRSIIDSSAYTPSSSAYADRFGNQKNAYKLAGYTNIKPCKPDKVILDQLKKLYRKKGRLSKRIIDKSKITPSASTYSRRFNGIINAYTLVGYKPPDKLTHKYLLTKLSELLIKKGRLSTTIINSDKNSPDSSTYNKYFGSLLTAYQLIDYHRSPRYGMDDNQLLNYLRDIYKSHGYLSGKLINEAEGLPNRITYVRCFGNLSNAYKLIGYNRKAWGMPNSQMLRLLKELLDQKGALSRDIINQAKDIPCATSYVTHFGGLKGAYKKIGYR